MNRWKDWYDQGVRDLARAQLDVEHAFYEWACFTSQAAAEKVIKADYFSENKAREALDAASRIQRFCESLLS
jgi:HEPN domain-containing protein